MSDGMKDALEATRRKLEALRQKREARKKAKDRAAASTPATTARAPAAAARRPATSPGSADALLSSVSSLLTQSHSTSARVRGAAADGGSSSSSSGAAGGGRSIEEVKANLTIQPASGCSVFPAPVPTYEISVQAGEGLDAAAREVADGLAEEDALRREANERSRAERDRLEKEAADRLRAAQEAEQLKKRNMTAAQKRQLMQSAAFEEFFSSASRLVERAVNQNERFNIGVDYSLWDAEKKLEKDTFVSQQALFFDKERTYNRPTTAIDWSPRHPELLLASYGPQVDPMSLEPDGLVQVWSTELPQRPEFSFFCQSAVLSAQWHPSDPRLVIGGTSSGQVVVWDSREKRRFPVARTSLKHGHTHPLYAIATIPSAQLIKNIISVSTDGQLCVWNESDLVEPTTSIELKHDKKEVTTTCFDFPGRDSNSVVLGSDEGNLYKARLHEPEGIYECIKDAHAAPITSVQFHPMQKNTPQDMAELFLTSSMDWTVKLWSARTSRPLFTFEGARDYVYDCAWSPVHPSVFAVGDGTGSIDFWDLSRETEVPVHRARGVAGADGKHKSAKKTGGRDESKSSSESKSRDRAVSRIKWSDDGKQIAVGSSDGSLAVFDVAQELYQPAGDGSAFLEKMRLMSSE